VIVPASRWYWGAALLGLTALIALVWPQGALLLVAVDVAWVLALVIDAFRVAGVDVNRLEVVRTAPPAFSVGRDFPVSYRWRNHLASRVRLHVREAFPSVFGDGWRAERRIDLGPGEVAYEQALLRPVERGKAAKGMLHLRLRSPWGLAWRHVRRELPWASTVFPSLQHAALRALPAQARRRREAGLRTVRRLGEGRMFESLREWVPGDDTRTIDWKATARRGKPMARQYEDERRQHVLLAIDAGRLLTAEVQGRARLEAVIDAALQLAHAAVAHDDNVGLLVFADAIQHYIPPARGRRALREILDALATIEGRLVEPDYPSAFTFLATRNRKRALTVLFTDVIDRTASDALVTHVASLRPRHLPLAVALRNPEIERLATTRPPNTAGAFERAAAEDLLQARERALAVMRGQGVLILDVSPHGAAKAVVDQYHLLKRLALL
jgi:uncharacterized protein (DUF58 family)